MRIALWVLMLAGIAAGQSFSVAPAKPEAETVSVHFAYSQDPDFIEEQCFWHIYEQGKPATKPVTREGCKSIDYEFPNGAHRVELVINGRQKQYQHLSIEQRGFSKTITVASRLKVE